MMRGLYIRTLDPGMRKSSPYQIADTAKTLRNLIH